MSFDDYIFIRPSFMSGVARALDIGGGLSMQAVLTSRTPADADARALASDWRITNRDVNKAMDDLKSSPGNGAR